jgi:hypothetical protein
MFENHSLDNGVSRMIGGTEYFSNYFTESHTSQINSNYEVYIYQNGKTLLSMH